MLERLTAYDNVGTAARGSSPLSLLPSHIIAPMTGAKVIANALRDLGVTVIFGLVGIPVVDIAEEAINLGIRFIGFRNEQACSYAATAYGYITGKPGVCLLVGGPGVLHGMAGVCIHTHSFCYILMRRADWKLFRRCLSYPISCWLVRVKPRDQRRIPRNGRHIPPYTAHQI